MTVDLRLSTTDDAQTVRNLWPLYQHDLSEFDGAVPNVHGIFNDDHGVTTLAQHVRSLDPWWSNPHSLFPYVILVDGLPVGFNLIAARSRLPDGIDADFVVHEFFVLRGYRGRSAAVEAALRGFQRHRGSWEVVTYPNHPRAIAFWRKVIGRHTAMRFSESELDHVWGRRVCFRFHDPA